MMEQFHPESDQPIPLPDDPPTPRTPLPLDWMAGRRGLAASPQLPPRPPGQGGSAASPGQLQQVPLPLDLPLSPLIPSPPRLTVSGQLSRPRSWQALSERAQRLLHWLAATTLIAEDDLRPLLWPDTATRQAMGQSLQRWADSQLLLRYSHEGQPCVQLGPLGARLLRSVGVGAVPSGQAVRPSARASLLLTNRFGSSLWQDAEREPGIAGMAWQVNAFRGAGVRSDGEAILLHTPEGQPARRGRSLTMPDLLRPDAVPPAGMGLLRLYLEVDRGTESTNQLVLRATHWRQQWEQLTTVPDVYPLILWVTTGGWGRVETIWRAWVECAMLPAFFTTTAWLDAPPDRSWQPLHCERLRETGRHPVWYDCFGRARQLLPWAGHEPIWRYGDDPPITQTSLRNQVLAMQQGR